MSSSSRPDFLALGLLPDLLGWRAKTSPEDIAFVWAGEDGERTLTFAELDRRARAIASVLQARKLQGVPALMLYPIGLEFVEAFFGCLYAGTIAVPLQPGRGRRAMARLSSVLGDCRPGAILSAGEISTAPEMSDLPVPVIRTETIASEKCRDFEPPSSRDPDSVAFLQYTSGSTSTPKGTMVTHRNIMANEAMIQEIFGVASSSVIVSWLPIFHDMGLIGNVLQGAYSGAKVVLLPTLAIIQDPILWLKAIERYKAGFSGGPSFAYELCLQKIPPGRREGLDLSSWQVAFNGAEPVRPDVLEKFSEAFAPHGFRASAPMPTYGLAEATLAVSGSRGRVPVILPVDSELLKSGLVRSPAPGARNMHRAVSCGHYSWGDQDVRIVDPATHAECPSMTVGEIWISGSHVARGYWKNEEATRETFQAEFAGGGGVRYLRTGDLGFVKDGELYVSGRIKDLIILNGQNHYPQDLELTAERSCPELRAGATAAFLMGGREDGGSQGVTIVAEWASRSQDERESRKLLATIRHEVGECHQLSVERVVLVKPGSVPKTTSGKIQRSACRESYAKGKLGILALWESPAAGGSDLREQPREIGKPEKALAREELGNWLAAWLSARVKLPLSRIDFSLSLADHGLNSLGAVDLSKELSEQLGRPLDKTLLWSCPTIEALIASLGAGAATEPPVEAKRPATRDALESRLDEEIARLEGKLRVA